MDAEQQLDRLHELLDRGPDGAPAPVTSVRIPRELREAAAVAAEMQISGSLTDLVVEGLRDRLVELTRRAALEAHYAVNPDARPTLAEVAQLGAELDGNPLAAEPQLIARAARDLGQLKENPSPDDVLTYASGLAAARSSARKRRPSDAA